MSMGVGRSHMRHVHGSHGGRVEGEGRNALGQLRSHVQPMGGSMKGMGRGRGAWVVGAGQVGGHALGPGKLWME